MRNAAVEYSLKHGKPCVIAGTTYIGLPAVYDRDGNKTQLGVPFVRVEPK